MGIDLWVDEKQTHLTNAYWYNEFLNWVADTAAKDGEDFPHLLNHSPTEGWYELNEKARTGRQTGSVQKLSAEAKELLTRDPPDYALHILTQITKACKLAMLSGNHISLTYVPWWKVYPKRR